MNRLVLGHLSDIHFRNRVGGDTWDLDRDLRNELELDLARVVHQTGQLDGLLVTGDIAFSGGVEQYDEVSEWLRKLTTIAGCNERDVWMVPGNHDVQRSVVAASRTVADFHRLLRSCDVRDIDNHLFDYLVDDRAGGDAHLTPLSGYNAFAARYECSIAPAKPFWEYDVPIGDTMHTLRIRGLTSPLISDEHDDSDANRLVMGSVQANLMRRPRTITMTMSHHPISWLRDGEVVDDLLRTRAQIQLWGHRHTQSTRVMDGNVHLFAGAVHPQRNELNWEPRYNILDLTVDEVEDEYDLILHARVWKRQETQFGPDFDDAGLPVRRFRLRVAPSTGVEMEPREMTAEQPSASPPRDARRALAYAYSSLPFQQRLAIARELELLDPDTRQLPDQELFTLVLSRAVRDQKLALLWEAVDAARGEPMGDNPFLAEGNNS